MKKVLTLVLLIGILGLSTKTISSQEEKKESKTEISTEILRETYPSYNPRGRKDPFRNLLAAREKKKTLATGAPEITIDNINLIGIVKARGKFTAIITGPQDFPLFIKVGHKFSDGFVLSIQDTKVIFRKTKERGFPLFRPKDIVKELKLEELR